MINLNKIITTELLNEYEGSEKKKTVIINNEQYLLKLPDPTREKHNSLVYINNAISEYIGCKIFSLLGVPVQEVILGTYTDPETHKEKIACACKDVRAATEVMTSFEAIGKGVYTDDTDKAKEASFGLMRELASKIDIETQIIVDRYCEMFVADALIGNTDRHNGNWAVLRDKTNHKYRLSPVYDCGSSMAPLLSDERILKESELKNLIHNTRSAIVDSSGVLIHYRDFLEKTNDTDVINALFKIFPKIDMPAIKDLIYGIDCLSDERKSFYWALIQGKYTEVLLPAVRVHAEISQELIDDQKASLDITGTKALLNNVVLFLKGLPLYTRGSIAETGKKTEVSFVKTSGNTVCLHSDNRVFVSRVKNDYADVYYLSAVLSKLGLTIDKENAMFIKPYLGEGHTPDLDVSKGLPD